MTTPTPVRTESSPENRTVDFDTMFKVGGTTVGSTTFGGAVGSACGGVLGTIAGAAIGAAIGAILLTKNTWSKKS